jgi:hypothetical protein
MLGGEHGSRCRARLPPRRRDGSARRGSVVDRCCASRVAEPCRDRRRASWPRMSATHPRLGQGGLDANRWAMGRQAPETRRSKRHDRRIRVASRSRVPRPLVPLCDVEHDEVSECRQVDQLSPPSSALCVRLAAKHAPLVLHHSVALALPGRPVPLPPQREITDPVVDRRLRQRQPLGDLFQAEVLRRSKLPCAVP